jgi:methionyl-tRNA formyltransferase
MRLIFMGTGEIALPSLRWLIHQSGHEIVGVYTQPDKPVGRKQILTPPEVKTIAKAAGIPVFQPTSLRKNPEALAELESLEPDLQVVMAYGQILPRTVIEAPEIACVNLHASLLPRHRGASPIQAAIREGDTESGITLMHIVSALDAGDMILKHTVPITPEDTGGSLHDKLAELGPGLLAEGLPLLESGDAPRSPQDENLVTYAPKLLREDGEIDWSLPTEKIALTIRAYDPWPGTTAVLTTERGSSKLKVFPPAAVSESSDIAGLTAEPGTAIPSAEGDAILVRCGDGNVLRLSGALQMEGRKRLPLAEFLRGQPFPAGTKLE